MSSQSVSTDTLFQAKRSHYLSSSSDLGAGSLYVFSSSSTMIQMVSRGFSSREFPGRSPFAIKFPNPSIASLLHISTRDGPSQLRSLKCWRLIKINRS